MKHLKKGGKLEVLKELEKEDVSRETLMAVGVASSSAEMIKIATSYKIQEGDEVMASVKEMPNKYIVD